MKGKIRWVLLIEYIGTVIFAELSAFVSLWFLIGVVYILLHLFFGPLDWYFTYKLYKKLMEMIR